LRKGHWTSRFAYTKDRKQFGRSIFELSSHSIRAGGNGDEGRGGELMVYTAAARAHRGEPTSPSSLRLQMLRIRRCHGRHRIAVQLLGGAGYTRDFPVERMMRDAKITQNI